MITDEQREQQIREDQRLSRPIAVMEDVAALLRLLDAERAKVAALIEVHGRYFDLAKTPSIMTDTAPEPEDVWRYDRDFRAALGVDL